MTATWLCCVPNCAPPDPLLAHDPVAPCLSLMQQTPAKRLACNPVCNKPTQPVYTNCNVLWYIIPHPPSPSPDKVCLHVLCPVSNTLYLNPCVQTPVSKNPVPETMCPKPCV
jgi:hypothetical protein